MVPDCGWMTVKSVADGTTINVNSRSGGQIGRVRLHVGANDFTLDPRVERNVNQLALVWKCWIIHRHRYLAIHEVHDDNKRNQYNYNDQSKDEAHGVLPPPQKFIVEHEFGVRGKKQDHPSKRSQP